MVFKFFSKKLSNVSNALSKSRKAIGGRIAELFGRGINQETMEHLEEILYEADLGVATAEELTEKICAIHKDQPDLTASDLIKKLQEILIDRLENHEKANKSFNFDLNLEVTQAKGVPLVILIVGVNGNGKTTSIAKLAKYFQSNGKKVLLGAADTFRAAAIDQLDTWATRLDVSIVKGQPNADPSAVVFDSVNAAVARKMDVVLIDTAGRLQTKTDLMKELEKMKRSCAKVLPDAPHETLLVLDASTGHNAIDQAKTFTNYAPLTGLILTKLDGTAKGGIAVPICQQLGIPIKFIGTGEGADDFETFDPKSYVEALFVES